LAFYGVHLSRQLQLANVEWYGGSETRPALDSIPGRAACAMAALDLTIIAFFMAFF